MKAIWEKDAGCHLVRAMLCAGSEEPAWVRREKAACCFPTDAVGSFWIK